MDAEIAGGDGEAGRNPTIRAAMRLEQLSEALRQANCQGLSSRNLYNFWQVAVAYPELDASEFFQSVLPNRTQ